MSTTEQNARQLEGTPLGDKLANIYRNLFSERIKLAKDDEPEESKAVSGLAEYISPEDCIASKQHLTVCDKDGFCNYCGHQAEETEDQS